MKMRLLCSEKMHLRADVVCLIRNVKLSSTAVAGAGPLHSSTVAAWPLFLRRSRLGS